MTVDGETFQVGDSAYLRMTEDFNEDDFADEEVCQLCGCAEPEDIPILECNKCLLGYHLTCLRPPLADVPKVSQKLANFVAIVRSAAHTNTSLHYHLQLHWSWSACTCMFAGPMQEMQEVSQLAPLITVVGSFNNCWITVLLMQAMH